MVDGSHRAFGAVEEEERTGKKSAVEKESEELKGMSDR
jgi:hypothetical protein